MCFLQFVCPTHQYRLNLGKKPPYNFNFFNLDYLELQIQFTICSYLKFLGKNYEKSEETRPAQRPTRPNNILHESVMLVMVWTARPTERQRHMCLRSPSLCTSKEFVIGVVFILTIERNMHERRVPHVDQRKIRNSLASANPTESDHSQPQMC